MSLSISTSMAFDAICACLPLAGESPRGSLHPVQAELIDLLRERTGGFAEGCLSFSTLCGILSHTALDPVRATLDELIAVFSDPAALDRTVRGRITNEFVASFTLPMLDMLRDGWGERYARYMKALRDADFEALWQARVRPVVEAERDRLLAALCDVDIDAVLAGVSRLKDTPVSGVWIYVSLLSRPVSFSLADNGFLQCVGDWSDRDIRRCFPSLIAHELMHGFASGKTVEQYRAFMDATPYLRATHRSLIEEQRSGDEEEMVMAAEYDILCRAGILTREQIMRMYYGRYGYCVPLSFYLFDALSRETTPVSDYDAWLATRFRDGTLTPAAVPETVLSMLPPPTDEEGFDANLFTRFCQGSYSLRETQTSGTDDRKAEIEAAAGGSLCPNDDRNVRFGIDEKRLDPAVRRETLTAERLTVDALIFPDRSSAFSCMFSHTGANISAPAVELDGQTYRMPHTFNLAFMPDGLVQIEIAFIAHTTRYLVTAQCPAAVRFDSQGEAGETFFARCGVAIIDTVDRAMTTLGISEGRA